MADEQKVVDIQKNIKIISQCIGEIKKKSLPLHR